MTIQHKQFPSAKPNKKIALDALALTALSVASFGFFSLAIVNVFSDSSVSRVVFSAYYQTLGNLFPSIDGAYGLNASIFLAMMLVSFAILFRSKSPKLIAFNMLRLSSCVILLFEMGLHLAAPEWRDVFVIAAQVGTPLQWFTNDELLFVAAMTLVTLQTYALLRPHITALGQHL